jgi:hypothetical protein
VKRTRDDDEEAQHGRTSGVGNRKSEEGSGA